MHASKGVLFLCESDKTAFSEFFPLAQWLRGEGVNAQIALARPDEGLEAKMKAAAVPYMVLNTVHAYVTHADGAVRPLALEKCLCPGFLLKIPVVRGVIRIGQQIGDKLRLKKAAVALLRQQNIGVLCVYHEGNIRLAAEMIAAARAMRCKILRIQMTRTPLAFLARRRLGDPAFQVRGLLNTIYALLCPGHVIEEQGQRLLFYRAVDALVLKAAGMLPSRPWHNGESFADANLMLSEFHIQKEREEGSRLDQAVVTGQFSLDVLYDNYKNIDRAALHRRYFPNGGAGRPLIIVALPQLMEHDIFPAHRALDEIRHLLRSFSSLQGCDFLISLHPKMDFDLYSGLITQGSNCAIASERLSEILPAGDVLVACFESILSWAILCDMTPVMLDYYDLGFDVSHYKSCVCLRDKSRLAEDLEAVIGRKDPELLQADRAALPPFDGQARMRIKQALQNFL